MVIAMLPDRTSFRLSSRLFTGLRRGTGRDLLETIYGGWLDDSLWSKYQQPLDVYDDAACAELRAYRDLARRTRKAMGLARARSRHGTHYRIASAVIDELASGATWTLTQRASECACRHTEFAHHLHGVYLTVLAGARRDLDKALDAYRSVIQ